MEIAEKTVMCGYEILHQWYTGSMYKNLTVICDIGMWLSIVIYDSLNYTTNTSICFSVSYSVRCPCNWKLINYVQGFLIFHYTCNTRNVDPFCAYT